ncbi:family 43 glycosylhydrolase [Klebsiella variicola subsp. variicola]|nr:family 43 glycosylhydrolase [Klebsiella variicola subsp. variicola]
MPTPSIIRVEDTYYIANSTFEWFPGVRLHESKDLKNWNLLPSPLSTTTLLDKKGNPLLRRHLGPGALLADGQFWLVYTDVKVTEGAFKDMTNYLTTAKDIRGPWSDPIKLNGVGFDASLFHDDDGRKYIVQQTRDHREYHHPFDGITLTELDTKTLKLMPETARTIYRGTAVALVEGPHLYKLNGYYYLFAAQGGTVFTHQEVVARSKTLEADSFETEPGDVFLTNVDTPGQLHPETGAMAHWSPLRKANGITPRSAPGRGIARGNPSTTRAAGQPSAGKPRSRKCTGTTRAGRVLKAVTAGKPSSKDRKTPSSPKAPAIIASRMTLPRQRSTRTGIPCECRLRPKWAPPATAN